MSKPRGKLVQSNVGADADHLWARLKLDIGARRHEKSPYEKSPKRLTNA